jgi:HSP20 family protein
VLIIAALPGVEAEDLKVELDGCEVIISGLRRLPAIPHDTAIRRLEIPCGRFERRIRLTATKLKLAQSELESGCLTLRLTTRP